jgi:hypothetical protein
MDREKLERFVEFLVVGIFLGVTEDLLAVMLATDAEFSWKILWIVVAVSVPFAAFSELIVDSDEYLIIEKISERIHGWV